MPVSSTLVAPAGCTGMAPRTELVGGRVAFCPGVGDGLFLLGVWDSSVTDSQNFTAGPAAPGFNSFLLSCVPNRNCRNPILQ
jgi:hypothetical protein